MNWLGKEGVVNSSISGLLDRGCEFEGKLAFEGSVRINGKFSGEIFSEGTLVIGEGAHVKGKVEVGSVILHGEFEGSVVAADRIEMHAPAIVRGDITAQTLVIDEGVFFEGNCAMGRRADLQAVENPLDVDEEENHAHSASAS